MKPDNTLQVNDTFMIKKTTYIVKPCEGSFTIQKERCNGCIAENNIPLCGDLPVVCVSIPIIYKEVRHDSKG
jgi:hypothetical protein